MTAMPGPEGIKLTITGNAMTIAALVPMLQQYAGRLIIDKTNLDGLYDFRVEFGMEVNNAPAATPGAPGAAPPVAADPGGSSIFAAMQEQLGLKLEPSRGPVNVLVIDSVQKPSEN
jgi:uncharacterized protein (TIGR03435 family)